MLNYAKLLIFNEIRLFEPLNRSVNFEICDFHTGMFVLDDIHILRRNAMIIVQ